MKWLVMGPLFVLLLQSVPAQAQFAGGNGSAGDPFQINSAEGLNEIRNGLSSHYVLTADIDMTTATGDPSGAYWNSGNGWNPIGDMINQFTGSINGAGHSITGLFINRLNNNYIALISSIDNTGTVDNIRLLEVNITGRNYTGSLVGINEGTITKSSISGSVSGSNISNEVGGLAGTNEGTIIGSSVTGSVNGHYYVGGLVGRNDGTVNTSSATGSVSGEFIVGGIVGRNAGTITNNYATGNVSSDIIVGGIVGRNTGTITNNYATGSVSGINRVGGLVGDNRGLITNSYATGSASGDDDVGGLVGLNSNGGTDTNSYWYIETGGPDNGIGTGLTSAQMRQETSFGGFDFIDDWQILEGFAFPMLRENTQDPPPGIIPEAPVVVSPVNGAQRVALQPLLEWDSASVNSEAATETYDLQVSLNSDFASPIIEQTGLAGNTYQVPSSLDPGTTIYWRVRGVNSSGEGYWGEFSFTTTTFTAGDGTSGDPYQIANVDQLNEVRFGLEAHYILTADIDLTAATGDELGAYWNGGEGWDAISTIASPFTGSIDGAGYKITGLFINRPANNNNALIRRVGNGGTVENIHLVEVNITGLDLTGGLVARNDGTINGSSVTGSVNGENEVGGLVGWNLNGTINTSYATGSVNGDNVGGFVGRNDGVITISYATSSVSGQSRVGGLVGDNSGSVNTSYATGSVNGDLRVGGLVGVIRPSATVTSSYATGSVNGVSRVGGLVGSNDGSVNTSYWNTETGGPDNGIGTGLTSAEMRQQTSFGLLDFNADWQILEGFAFPVLQDNLQDPPPGLIPPDAPVADTPADEAQRVNLQPLLEWDPASVNSQTATETYDLQVSLNSDFSSPIIEQTGLTGDTYQVPSSVDPDATIYWRVRGVNSSGDGDWGEFSFTTTTFTAGDGTGGDPYQIANVDQLNEVRFGLDAHYILTADIDMANATGDPSGAYWNGGLGWDAISTIAYPFTGSIDGAGYTISGLFINRPANNNNALIRRLGSGGTVENIRLVDVNITGLDYTGGLVAFNLGMITYSSVSGGVSGRIYVGGLAGWNEGTIRYSYTTGSVSGRRVGGLVGVNRSLIHNSYATGSVSGDSYIGGLVGWNNHTITNSYAIGNVNGTGSHFGGLVGWNNGTVNTSYWNSETGVPDNGQGTGLTSAQMRQETSFGEFNFDDDWQMNERLSFPFLKENPQDPPPGHVPASGTTANVPTGQAGAPTTITLTSLDIDDEPVSGLSVLLSVSITDGPNSGGSLSTITDNDDGTYTLNYTPTALGTDEITITLNGDPVSGSPVESEVIPGKPDYFTLDGPAQVTAGQISGAFTLRMLDAYDNEAPVSESTLFDLSSTGSTFYSDATGTTTITQLSLEAGESVAEFYYASTETGDHSITAAWVEGDPGLDGESETHLFSMISADANRLEFTVQPGHTTAGQAIDPAVTVRVIDEFGNPVDDFSGEVTLVIGTNPAGGTLSGTTTLNATDGIVTFEGLSIDKTGEGYTLVASGSGLINRISDSFTIVPDEVSLGNTTADVPVQGVTGSATVITITVRDSFNNPVNSAGGLLNVNVSNGPNSGASFSTITDHDDGSYSLNYTPTAPGIDKITITLDGSPVAGSPFESEVSVGSADPGKTIADVPAEGITGSATVITVTIRDGFNNPVAGAAGQLDVSVSSGPNSGTTFSAITDNGDGSYTTAYNPTGAGSDQIRILLNGNPIQGSPYTSIVILDATEPGAPQELVATAGDGQAVLVWQAPGDDGGAPVIEYRVQFSTDGGASWTDDTSGGSSATNQRTINGLDNHIGHRFRVAAINKAGEGPFSQPSNVVIPAGPAGDSSGALPLPDTGSGEGYVNGEPVELSFVVGDDGKLQLVLGNSDVEMVLTTLDLDSESIPISSFDEIFRLLLEEGASILLTGTGFDPGTYISVWLFSEPVLLGHIEVDEDGSFEGNLALPPGITAGPHTLQIVGLGPDGEQRSVNIGVLASQIRAPENISLPFIETDTPAIGDRISGDPGEWTATPDPVLSIQWLRCEANSEDLSECVAISGATEQDYTVIPGDLGHSLRIQVTADNGIYEAISAISSQTGTVGVGEGVASQAMVSVADGVAGEPTLITLELRDDDGNAVSGAAGYIDLDVSEGPNRGAAFTPVSDDGDGFYSAAYTPEQTGTDRITITIDGSQIGEGAYQSVIGPMIYMLRQNYPNPFIGTTTIEYDIPAVSKVTIAVYDILGRKVTTIVDEPGHAPGTHKYEWRPPGLGSGIYIYRIIARDNTNGQVYEKIHKMTLVK